jgi:hypothetical protein
VSAFKRRLIETTLVEMRGNRTHTPPARLQRTYLLRLMRDLRVTAPPATRPVARDILRSSRAARARVRGR